MNIEAETLADRTDAIEAIIDFVFHKFIFYMHENFALPESRAEWEGILSFKWELDAVGNVQVDVLQRSNVNGLMMQQLVSTHRTPQPEVVNDVINYWWEKAQLSWPYVLLGDSYRAFLKGHRHDIQTTELSDDDFASLWDEMN